MTLQRFAFAYFQGLAPGQLARVAPTPLSFAGGTDFDVMDVLGAG